MNPLEKAIIEKIKKEGQITFETFMDMALYYPDLGYYSSPDAAIGREGDYYTSPHLHPIFGAMVARLLIEMWEIVGRPGKFCAIEMGAGVGYLCKDILDYLSKSKVVDADFLESLHYIIVEPYEHFEERQRELLGDLAKKITWIKEIRTLELYSPRRTENDRSAHKILSGQITGCVFSNELLDAFPVHLIEINDKVEEVYVTHVGNNFNEIKQDISSIEIINYINLFSMELPSRYRTEINLRIKKWLEEIDKILSEGFVLTIDYGYSAKEYYSIERMTGTLLCYHQHMFNENPYQHIGQQDITAHVNFSSLKKWGDALGFKNIGFCSQGTFLTASGIDQVIAELYSGTSDYLSEVSKIKGLIMPQGMGESHMVMIHYKGTGFPQLKGFSIRNQVDLL